MLLWGCHRGLCSLWPHALTATACPIKPGFHEVCIQHRVSLHIQPATLETVASLLGQPSQDSLATAIRYKLELAAYHLKSIMHFWSPIHCPLMRMNSLLAWELGTDRRAGTRAVSRVCHMRAENWKEGGNTGSQQSLSHESWELAGDWEHRQPVESVTWELRTGRMVGTQAVSRVCHMRAGNWQETGNTGSQ